MRRSHDENSSARRVLASDDQSDPAEDRGGREDEAQRHRLTEQQHAAHGRDHGHAELHRRLHWRSCSDEVWATAPGRRPPHNLVTEA